MTKEELIKRLIYIRQKHKDDKYNTGDTNILLMCNDVLDVLSRCEEINWIPLVWDEYPTVDMDGNDDYVYAVDYSVPMPKEDEWVLITDENHNVRTVQYDGYDFGDYVREEILAWAHSPMPYKDWEVINNDKTRMDRFN